MSNAIRGFESIDMQTMMAIRKYLLIVEMGIDPLTLRKMSKLEVEELLVVYDAKILVRKDKEVEHMLQMASGGMR